MPDLEDRDSRAEYIEKGGHDRQIYPNSLNMSPTWRQQQCNRQFIRNSEKHLFLCHRAD